MLLTEKQQKKYNLYLSANTINDTESIIFSKKKGKSLCRKIKRSKKSAEITILPNQAISAYEQSADPLGSYTGVTDDMINPGKNMPRRDVGGKIYMRVEEQPVQDADDL